MSLIVMPEWQIVVLGQAFLIENLDGLNRLRSPSYAVSRGRTPTHTSQLLHVGVRPLGRLCSARKQARRSGINAELQPKPHDACTLEQLCLMQ
jgi:hypothetical protein